MRLLSLLEFILCLHLVVASAFSGLVDVSLSDLSALNATVGGRLYRASPFARPCFRRFEKFPNAVNETACSAIQENYTAPEFRVQSFGSYMMPEWETCQQTQKQCLLDSSDPFNPHAFEDATCFEGSVAPYYIDIGDASHVQAAFAFANRTGVKLSIKNSGHDYKGRSSGRNTLGLWVHNLKSLSYNVKFTPEGCDADLYVNAITTGTGTSWKEAYAFADGHNVTLIGGYHETVGAAGGWLMGGGHSVLSPVYGLGVDRVLQVRIVTPDGELRVANECQNPDIFWALRGGGGGTFGVLLEATYKVESQLTLQIASLAFNGTTDNLPTFYSTLLNNSLKWGNEGWGGHVTQTTMIYVNPLLSLTEARESMKPMSDWIASQNGTVVVETLPSWYAFFEKYVLSAEGAVGTPRILTSRLIPKSIFESEDGRKSFLDVILGLLKFGIPNTPVVPPVLYNASEGSTSITPAWRSALWHFETHGAWDFNSTTSEIEEQYAFVHNVAETLHRLAPDSGAYFNEGDVYEPEHEKSYWGPNYPRLLEIKKKYDPFHLLDCWQCVGWKGPLDEQYKCYLPEPANNTTRQK